MNIPIQKSELVTIEGLTEAAVTSPDRRLIEIIRFGYIASSYYPDDSDQPDQPSHPVQQLIDACFHELCRRHGEFYSLPDDEGELACELCGAQI